MRDANDMELVRDYAARNSELAFETLVRRHVSMVYSVALRLVGNPDQAEEITQAVFLILARKAALLSPDTVLGGWLHETTRFVSASFLRNEQRRRHREQEAYMQSKVQESSAEPAWEKLAPLLDEAIGQLGKADRNAVVLRFFQYKSAREIADVLNVHESAAQKRLNRAVEKLRAYFLKRGVAVSVGGMIGAISANSVQGAPVHLAASIMAVSAKGTAISSSTLTLIKGALKIMAWTKVKTAIVVGAAVILAGGTTTIVIHHNNHKNDTFVWTKELTSDEEAHYEKTTGLRPEQVAKIFFEGCEREDWTEVTKFYVIKNDEFKKYYAGLKVLSLGKPFRAGFISDGGKEYHGVCVPYVVRLKNGEVHKWQLAVAGQNSGSGWYVDGGTPQFQLRPSPLFLKLPRPLICCFSCIQP